MSPLTPEQANRIAALAQQVGFTPSELRGIRDGLLMQQAGTNGVQRMELALMFGPEAIAARSTATIGFLEQQRRTLFARGLENLLRDPEWAEVFDDDEEIPSE